MEIKIIHDHPEVIDLNNICDTIPHEKSTKDVCHKFNKEKKQQKKNKKSKL